MNHILLLITFSIPDEHSHIPMTSILVLKFRSAEQKLKIKDFITTE